jgi:hypothetical protein
MTFMRKTLWWCFTASVLLCVCCSSKTAPSSQIKSQTQQPAQKPEDEGLTPPESVQSENVRVVA